MFCRKLNSPLGSREDVCTLQENVLKRMNANIAHTSQSFPFNIDSISST